MGRVAFLLGGLEQLEKSLHAKRDAYSRGMKKGVILAALLVQGESQKIVPVDTGNLRASAGTRYVGNGVDKHDAEVFYTAAYAIYVHEDLEARHQPGKTAQFIVIAMQKNRLKIVEIIKNAILLESGKVNAINRTARKLVARDPRTGRFI